MSTVLLEREGAVCVLTLNRPEKLNALNAELLGELDKQLVLLTSDASVSCVIVTGAGDKAFAAGADIAAMLEMTTEQARAFSEQGHRICSLIERAPFPVIGAVNGFALGGGCELALSCDFLYASDKAKLGQPEVNLGVMPGFGGTQRLARRVGIGRARELCYTGDAIAADEALRIGLVNHVVAHEKLLDKGLELARMVAARGPVAVKMCKHLVQRGQDLDLANANAMEADVFGFLCATEDRHEGMAAFLAKRPPAFKGR
jgi:enoyl-CoA hydratase